MSKEEGTKDPEEDLKTSTRGIFKEKKTSNESVKESNRLNQDISRRHFLKKTGAAALGLGALLSPISARYYIKDDSFSVQTSNDNGDTLSEGLIVDENQNVNIPNGVLEEQSERVATRSWADSSFLKDGGALEEVLTVKSFDFSGNRIDFEAGSGISDGVVSSDKITAYSRIENPGSNYWIRTNGKNYHKLTVGEDITIDLEAPFGGFNAVSENDGKQIDIILETEDSGTYNITWDAPFETLVWEQGNVADSVSNSVHVKIVRIDDTYHGRIVAENYQ